MAPPPADRRSALGRIVDALRRRLRRQGRGAPPATVPGLGSGEEAATAAAARHEPDPPVASQPPAEPGPPSEPDVEPQPPAEPAAPQEAGARIDAARERLRAKIEPPRDTDETD